MSINENIRKFRRDRELTQETLAELLHITPQAVSRWENGTTSPDAPAIVSLARIFDCTTDELLGMHSAKKEERIQYYKDLVEKTSRTGEADGEKVIAVWREALKEYPGEFELMKQLAESLSYYSGYYDNHEPEKSGAMKQEAVDLLEYVAAHCRDIALLGDVYRSLYTKLLFLGRREEAAKYLKYFPTMWHSREVMEFEVGTPSETTLILTLTAILRFYEELRIFDKNKTTAEQLEIARQLDAIHIAFGYEYRPERFLPFAWVYAGAKNTEKTLEYLKKATQAAVMCDDPVCTAYRRTKHNTPSDYRDDLAEELSNPRYNFVRNTAEFAEILRMIAK